MLNAENMIANNSRFTSAVWRWMFVAVIGIASVAAFYPSLSGATLEWGDRNTITDNPLLNGPFSLAAVFSTAGNGAYQPLYVLLLKLLQLFGASADTPFLFHVSNLALHTLTAISIFFLFGKVGMRTGTAFACALLFAVHPLHVGTVAWISGGGFILSALLSVLSVSAYVRYVQTTSRLWLYLALALFVLAILSGTQALVLPFVLLATDYLLKREWSSQKIIVNEKLGWWIISAITAIGQLFYYLRIQAPEPAGNPHSLPERLALGATNFLKWPVKAIWPSPLSYYYLPSFPVNIIAYICLLGAPLLLLLAVKIAGKQNNRPVVWGLWAYSILILPGLGIFPTTDSYFADTHAYLAIAGLLFAVGIIADRYTRNNRAMVPIGAAATGILGIIFAILSWQHSSNWQTMDKLLAHHISSDPDSYFGYDQAGQYHLKEAFKVGGNDAARLQYLITAKNYFTDAIRIDSIAGRPNPVVSSDILQSAGVVCGLTGEPLEAVRYFSSAIMLTPQNAEALKNRGYQYFLTKQYVLAIADYSAAITLKPQESDLYYMRANCNYSKGNLKEAHTDLDKAISLGTNDPNCFIAMAVVYRAEGDTAAAINFAVKARDLGANVPDEYLH
jgi:tetratricopeptide (TPR) repeat protein